METEAIIALIALAVTIITMLAHISYQVGKFVKRVEFVEDRLEAQEKIQENFDDRLGIVEKKLPLMVIRGRK